MAMPSRARATITLALPLLALAACTRVPRNDSALPTTRPVQPIVSPAPSPADARMAGLWTSIVAHLRRAYSLRASWISRCTCSMSVYSVSVSRCRRRRRLTRICTSRSGSVIRPTTSGRLACSSSIGGSTAGTSGTFAARTPRLAR